jgi:hypothetical protein
MSGSNVDVPRISKVVKQRSTPIFGKELCSIQGNPDVVGTRYYDGFKTDFFERIICSSADVQNIAIGFNFSDKIKD